jgi:His-Xaa-Ser system protein HxsD
MINDFNTVEFDEKHATATISVDKKVYSKGAILRAFYWLSKDLHCRIDEESGCFRVRVGLKVSAPTLNQPRVKNIDEWIPEIFDALLDSQLRVEIQTETAAVRELIIAKAFAESGILEDPPPGTFEDPVKSNDRDSRTLISIKNKLPRHRE